MIVGNTHFVEEHFVETCTTGHLAKRTNFYTRCAHVNDEARETFVFRQTCIATANDFANVAELCA